MAPAGGYQVCQKGLKDRKGRELSYDDLRHYRGIVSAYHQEKRQHVLTVTTWADICDNCPYPYNPKAEISFSLPNAADAKVDIYNVTEGWTVATPADGIFRGGPPPPCP